MTDSMRKDDGRSLIMEFHYTVAAQTDRGIVKEVNQDSLTVKVADTAYGETALAVLCDGMGGLEQGEVASGVVVHTFEQWFMKEFPALLERGMQSKALAGAWKNMIDDCNLRIHDYSSRRGTTMGTTLTVMMINNGSYYIAHVGDCRAYRMDTAITRLTQDHTYTEREVALGHMTPEQAQNDSRRSVLLQCIGLGKPVEPDFISGRIKQGDSYLLCSDGFRNRLSEEEIFTYCHCDLYDLDWSAANRHENARLMNARLGELIALNKQRMEKDNISAVMIKIS
ncbi:MAG: protein phosphatase 2C domain-containing protein [Roseburia sp.]|nr:protein phosphatase 2C domain-containing protein [Roseburia sp.]